jgi:hypothetical protein
VIVEDNVPKKGELVFEFASSQLRHMVNTYPDALPSFTIHGKWQPQVEGWTYWCEVFAGGQLWLVYFQTGDEWFYKKAERYACLIEPRKTDRFVHDFGRLLLIRIIMDGIV